LPELSTGRSRDRVRGLEEESVKLPVVGESTVEQDPHGLRYDNPLFFDKGNLKRGRDLLTWAGAEVTLVDRCCGMDGTWGMKTEFFEASLKVAERAANAVESAAPDVVSSDCPLAGLQLTQKTGRRSFHPVRLLHGAYFGDTKRSPKAAGREQPTSDDAQETP
jgi:glycerol-3-phosphate dehydrogenase subunit C